MHDQLGLRTSTPLASALRSWPHPPRMRVPDEVEQLVGEIAPPRRSTRLPAFALNDERLVFAPNFEVNTAVGGISAPFSNAIPLPTVSLSNELLELLPRERPNGVDAGLAVNESSATRGVGDREGNRQQ